MTGKDNDAKTKPLPGEKVTSAQDITARLVFQGPAMVRWSRHDQEGKTNFISAFYLLPAGFGRTRFMSRRDTRLLILHCSICVGRPQPRIVGITQYPIMYTSVFADVAGFAWTWFCMDMVLHGHGFCMDMAFAWTWCTVTFSGLTADHSSGMVIFAGAVQQCNGPSLQSSGVPHTFYSYYSFSHMSQQDCPAEQCLLKYTDESCILYLPYS